MFWPLETQTKADYQCCGRGKKSPVPAFISRSFPPTSRKVESCNTSNQLSIKYKFPHQIRIYSCSRPGRKPEVLSPDGAELHTTVPKGVLEAAWVPAGWRPDRFVSKGLGRSLFLLTGRLDFGRIVAEAEQVQLRSGTRRVVRLCVRLSLCAAGKLGDLEGG